MVAQLPDAPASPILNQSEARALTDQVKEDAAALWDKLLRLYEGDAHTALGYSSWGKYYAAEFGQSENYGYRLLKSARVMRELPVGNHPPTEAVARELVPVLRENPDAVREAWSAATQKHGPTPTASQVREVVSGEVLPMIDGPDTAEYQEHARKVIGDAVLLPPEASPQYRAVREELQDLRAELTRAGELGQFVHGIPVAARADFDAALASTIKSLQLLQRLRRQA